MKRILIFCFVIILSVIAYSQEITPPLISFNAGEISPPMKLRSDYVKYDNACKELENMLILTQGPAMRRPGLKYIGQALGTATITLEKSSFVTTYISENGYVEILDNSYTVTDTITLPAAGAISIDVDKDGNIVVGQTSTGLARYDSDGTYEEDFYVPDGGWVAGLGLVTGVRFTHDSNYLYVLATRSGNLPYLYKFNNTTGAEEWNIVLTDNQTIYGIEVDSSDNVYVPFKDYPNAHQIYRYDSDGNYDITFVLSGSSALGEYSRDIHIDEDLDRIYACSRSTSSGGTHTQVACVKLSDGSDLNTFQAENKSTIRSSAAITKGDYVYVVTSDATHPTYGDGSVWKLNYDDLTYVAHYDTGYGNNHIWLDWLDRIVVLGSTERKLYLFDDDLGLTAFYTCRSDRCQYGGEGVCVPSGVVAGTATETVDITTNALRLIPFEYRKTDAYILAFGDSYIGFYREQ